MATSGQIDNKLTSWLTLRIKWVVNSQNVANNTSNVTAYVQLISGNGYTSIGSRTITLKINGSEYTATSNLTISTNTTKTLMTKTVNVAHNSDGSKTCAFSCSVPFNATISGVSWTTKTASGSGTFNTIPRASTFTRSGTPTMGQAQTITITRASSSFTHKLYYTWAGTKTLIASNVGTSYSWTPPTSMASKIPNATSGSCTLTCETYNGSTLIGTNTLSFTLSVASNLTPTISAFTLSEAVDGIASQFGAFVNTQSKIAFSVTATGKNGATISSYSVSIAGQKFSASSGTTAVINTTAGTRTASVTVKDSRGYTTTKDVTFTVLEYHPPKFTTFSVERCDSSANLDDDGTSMKLTADISVAPVNNKNTVSYKMFYKKTTEATYKELTFSVSSYDFSGAKLFTSPTIPELSVDNSYNIRFQVIDFFTTVTKNDTLSSAKPILDILPDGSGMAAGKVAEIAGLFDFGYIPRFSEGIQNIIAEKVSDLNDIKTPNTYVTVNNGASSYANIPDDMALNATFTLEVMNAGAEGQIMQRLTVCSKTNPVVYLRYYFQDAWGEWLQIYPQNDSGWLDCALHESFEQYSTSNVALQIRKIGNIVHLRGVVKPTEDVTPTSDTSTLLAGFNIAYAPEHPETFVCQGSGAHKFAIHIRKMSLLELGLIYISRYTDSTAAQETIPAGTWLNCFATWFVD